jgi:SAM-dependent methyltransferase
MTDPWTSRWNERYQQPEYAYGVAPNNFLKEEVSKLAVGRILLPAEGEGRNAVFAAQLGWAVSAFDISVEGQAKAQRLAAKNGVTIDYQLIAELAALPYAPDQFDAIGLIYAHFPAAVKSAYHRALDRFLCPGGVVIFEAFSKQHLAYQAQNEHVGGPKDEASLFSLEEIRRDFPNYLFRELREEEVTLSEGLYHQGVGSVIRFVAVKQ